MATTAPADGPLFSVLLPTHDSPDTLGLSIASVLAQTRTDFELLVVGDGCTGPEADIVQGFGDPRIRWFDLPKAPGFGYANRNIALRQARGQLIAMAADDDLMLPGHLCGMAAEFTNPEVQWAYCRPLWVTGDGLILPAYANLRLTHARQNFMGHFNMIPSGCVVHRRSCLDEVAFWPENILKSGDWHLWRQMIQHYGPASIRFNSRPTQLHFRARWRDETDEFWPRFLVHLRAVALAGPGWYPPLRIEPAGGRSFQAQFWHELQSSPNRAERIAQAVQSFQDQLAWQATQAHLFN
ncbi:glycosyltransferase family 2 protein [Paracoccus sp. M683]|uniref:glycosyltransferase family 2 protein n=1 Tax=Paracoccus sp. M683 TaxID=2594268 RepID=UPI00117D1BA8|nr:glycosyltransferase family 2 protein [Paracoccus sp. M683]TRW97626.1 glycosyltransferase family 2 protein [Paracoccus sp. M683]